MNPQYTWVPNGAIPDLPDFRDWPYEPSGDVPPPSVDLRPMCPPIEDQLQLGSCTANALVGVLETLENIKHETFVDLSRLFLYYNTRALDGTITNGNEGYGASLRSAIKTAVELGACKETVWPYLISRWATLPTYACYSSAIEHRAVAYYRLSSLDDMKDCLASGYPFLIGINVYESFVGTVDGVINMPGQYEDLIAGHAVAIVGYDDNTQRFIGRNSWGTGWGMNGYFTIPYEYVSDPASPYFFDVWTVKQFYVPSPEADTPGTTDPNWVPVSFVVYPRPGVYNTEQLFVLLPSKPGKTYVSLNSGPYFEYTTGIPFLTDLQVAYYHVEESGFVSPIMYAGYTVDTDPMIVTPHPPAGTYRHVSFSVTANKPGSMYYKVPNGAENLYTMPVSIDESTVLSFYGVYGRVYGMQSIEYTIDPAVLPVTTISPASGRYFTPQFITLHSFEEGDLYYSIDGAEPVKYVTPVPITVDCTVEYWWQNGPTDKGVVGSAAYTIKESGIIYRVNGGPWRPYVGPFEAHHFQTIETAVLYPDGTMSDINIEKYYVIDTEENWITVA